MTTTTPWSDIVLQATFDPVFPSEFVDWLRDNEHVWLAFVGEADKLADKGFTHYSARTIVHYLRHHTAVTEAASEGWKINNDHSPYLARLFELVYPRHPLRWEKRRVKTEGLPTDDVSDLA